MSFRFVHEQPVRWGDIDSVGVLNNAVYLSFLEEARYGYFRHLDLLRDGQLPFLLGETKVRFLRPGRAGMVLSVAAAVRRLGGKSFEMEFEVRHGKDLLATASATLVFADEKLRSREIPPSARERIAAFEGIEATLRTPQATSQKGTVKPSIRRKVRPSSESATTATTARVSSTVTRR